ncbi:MAG: NAD(+) synthase [Alysiella sp.]|uniref:NAD(+) synthase n=1 Tax=Alysiella sp. TaxID=1872483 RepID=UPI0026DAE7A9|nr:NAD(+) synthase [Alysiella sp.]MDO4433006.1 NAD(+) synthase [Alysiella sp.]
MQCDAVVAHIVRWLRDYAEQAKAQGYVVGISGGIDSAVVSALCARTGLNVLCLTMPIRQQADQLMRGQAHMADLAAQFANVQTLNVDLTPTFEQFERGIASVSGCLKADNHDLAMANTRSRLRMATLYYYGQINGLLVAGTGNKIEDFGVGFFTKYGDGGVDVSPIADLLKSQVYELAKYLNVRTDIQTAVPTDGLWDSERTDEQQMGASYPELEWAMAQYVAGATRDAFSGRQQEVFDIFVRLNRATQHKIQPIPVCNIPTALL